MPACTLHVGRKELFQGTSPTGRFEAFFEDDGETGYFYARDLERKTDPIVDAVQIYNVANVTDADRPSDLSIVWSTDGTKCALLINDYPHAALISPQGVATAGPISPISPIPTSGLDPITAGRMTR